MSETMKTKRFFFGMIIHNGKILRRSNTPVVGGIAQSCITNWYLTAGNFYIIGDFIWKDGKSPSIIADDGKPCGLHKSFYPTDFIYFS